MQRKFAVTAGAVALGFTGMLGIVPAAAAAEPAPMSMQSNFFHVYEHDDFKGSTARFDRSDLNLDNNSWDGAPGRIINDNISSVQNRTDRDVVLYENAGCTGDPYLSQKNSEDKDLTNNAMDNRASCIKFG